MLVTEGKLWLSSELANCVCPSNTIAGKLSLLEYWMKVSQNSACLFIFCLYSCISETYGLCSPRQQLPMYFGTPPFILSYHLFTGQKLLVFLQMTDESFISWAWLNGASLSKSWEDCKRIILSWISFSLKYLITNFINHSCSAWTQLPCTSNLQNKCWVDFQIQTFWRKQSKIHYKWWQCGINMRYCYNFVIEKTQPLLQNIMFLVTKNGQASPYMGIQSENWLASF